jgi:hypothetical protein
VLESRLLYNDSLSLLTVLVLAFSQALPCGSRWWSAVRPAAAGALRILRIVWVKVKHVFLKLLGTLRNGGDIY